MKHQNDRERPIECSSCSRKISTKYSEVREKVVTCYYMCDDCPRLDSFLLNETAIDHSPASGLVCGHCGTSSLSLKRGEPLGCLDCYETFDVFISEELEEFSTHEPPQIQHMGHKPGELKEMSPNLKILALNEALAKTLNEENYEQAAWIRDQIAELKKKADKS